MKYYKEYVQIVLNNCYATDRQLFGPRTTRIIKYLKERKLIEQNTIGFHQATPTNLKFAVSKMLESIDLLTKD